MKFSSIRFSIIKDDYRPLKDISIRKLANETGIDEFLNKDRATCTVFPEGVIKLSPEKLGSASTQWGGVMEIHKDAARDGGIKTNALVAIHLDNVEIFPKAKLLIYDGEFVINDYLGSASHEAAKKWLNKTWRKSIFSISRTKSLPKKINHYGLAIDFSTDSDDHNVYHWTTRVLPKIKFIKQLPDEIPLAFYPKLTQLQLDCLQIFDIKNPIIVLEKDAISNFESYTLIEGPWAGANPPQLEWLTQEFKNRLPFISENHAIQSSGKKIFIYREEIWARKLLNREQVKDALVRQGYELHSFNGTSIVETARIFSSVDEIVFEHGAAGVWMIFTKPSVKIFEILPERNHYTSKEIANFFEWQAYVINRTYSCIVCKVYKMKPKVEYFVDIDLLLKRISSI